MRTAALALLMLVGGAVFSANCPGPYGTSHTPTRRGGDQLGDARGQSRSNASGRRIRAGAKRDQIVYWSRLTRVGLTDGHERVRTWLGDGPAAAGARIEARLFTPERHDATTDADARRRE